jgi:predicted TIM-barrel fold metal-dependent hydrolase
LPYLDPYWREQVEVRSLDVLDLVTEPWRTPMSVRPDWAPAAGRPGASLQDLQKNLLDPFKTRIAICNVVSGAQALFQREMVAAFCRGINDWVRTEWLDREPRLRASIAVPFDHADLAVEEIERCATDKRFVQILFFGAGEIPFGRRPLWPIYEAAVKHGLPIGIHSASAGRHATTVAGWPSTFIEEFAGRAQLFHMQLLSLITEGVFTKFPTLKVVLMESGITWLPFFYARADKSWRGKRIEVPWVKTPPSELVKQHVRFTLQPFDAPADESIVQRLYEQLGSDDLLLFSSDYPRWHFDGTDAVPAGISSRIVRQMNQNAMATYPRLSEETP